MRLANTPIPITCIPIDPGINRLATTPTIPINPRNMLTPSRQRPKNGHLSMAIPRTMKPRIMKSIPMKKNVLVKPLVACQKRVTIACPSVVAAA